MSGRKAKRLAKRHRMKKERGEIVLEGRTWKVKENENDANKNRR